MTNPSSSPGGNTLKRDLPFKVAVVGAIGAGKSSVCKLIADMGIDVIDADKLGHQLLSSPNPTYDAVLARFQADIRNDLKAELVDQPGAAVNRPVLAQYVFADGVDPKRKADLEAIMFPAIHQLLQDKLNSLSAKPLVVVELSMLFESGQQDEYDEIWCVLVDRETQLKRLEGRGMTQADALKRIAKQMPQEKKASRSTHVIDNAGTLDETKVQIEKWLNLAHEEVKRRQAAEAATCVDPVQSEETAAELKGFARLATNKVLDQMGDLSTTPHKEGDAQMTMRVTSKSTDPNGQSQTSEECLNLNLHMCVSKTDGSPSVSCCTGNSGSASGSPSTGGTRPAGGCSASCHRKPCGCGGCCNCSCSPPAPPPPSPPVPPPGPPANRHHCHWLPFFLAFLAFALVLSALIWCHPWSRTTVKVVTSVTAQEPCKNQPGTTITLTEEQFNRLLCGKKCPDTTATPVCPSPTPCPGTPATPVSPAPTPCPGIPATPVCPGTPAVPPCVPSPTCPGDTVGCCEKANPSPVAPAFIHRYLHNDVREMVKEWTVKCRGDNDGATVIGRDEHGRVVDWQEYGHNLVYIRHWIVRYSQSGDQISVELYGCQDRFAGRTAYRYNMDGRLIEVRRLDCGQRPMLLATFQRRPDGSFYQIILRRFETDGTIADVKTMDHVDQQFMTSQFEQYEQFGQSS